MEGPDVDLDSFPDPENRYLLGEEFGQGAFGTTFTAQDNEANGRKIAIKIQQIDEITTEFIKREYAVLKDLCQHPNVIEFYGAYGFKEKKEIWFITEVCIF